MKKNHSLYRVRVDSYIPFKDIIRKMKITLFVVLIFAIQVSAKDAYSQSTQFSLNKKNTTIEAVLGVIENQSEFYFLYNGKLVDVTQKVSINVENQVLEKTLNELFKSTDIAYKIYDRQVVLSPKASVDLSQQGKKVTGKVTDSSGASLPGASVVVKGTTTGVITDNSGNYSLSNIPENAILQFSFVGMKTQQIEIGSKTTINVSLVEETIGLEEVVSIGYGTVKRSDLTGAVSSINFKDLKDRQVNDIASLIQGKVSGVDVTSGKIRVRGVTSFNNTDPLYVVDGFVGGSIVNVNEIESIEILKDASATAIYGARGANGVILVSTKSGKKGPLKVNINLFTGIANTPKKIDVLNASQRIDYYQDALKNAGLAVPAEILKPEYRVDKTDWQNEIFKTARNSEFNIDFAGGSEKATFYVGLGYKYNEDIFIGPRHNKASIHIKNDFNLCKWLKVGDNLSFSYNSNIGSTPNLNWAIQNPTFWDIYDPTNIGGYSFGDRAKTGIGGANPLVCNLFHPEDASFDYQANFWADVVPFKGLKYRIQAGVGGSYSHFKSWQDEFMAGTNYTKNEARENMGYSFNPLVESTLTYENVFGKHNFSAMVGNTWQNYANSGGIEIYGQNYSDTGVKNVFNAGSRAISSQTSSNYAYLSYFGRMNYQFNNKYLLTVNIRRDGSPRFAPQNRWGTFPSIALAWKMHEEPFIKSLNIFDQLKLRTSWGVSGNDAIGEFRYASLIWTNGVYYPLGGKAVSGATVKDNASSDIKWESTDSKSLGFDMAFLKNSLTATVDYFNKNTNDILFTVPRAASLGYGLSSGGDAIVNAASCVNKGFELLVGYKGESKGIRFSINANYTYQNNEVTGLGLGQPYLSGVSRTDIGNPIGYIYGFVADGIYMKKSELDAANNIAESKGFNSFQEKTTTMGDVRYKDLNGDGRITWDGDRKMIGNAIPKHLYGLNISIIHKGFDLNVYFQGIAGSSIYDSQYQYNRQNETYVLDRWRSEADPGNGIVPRAVQGDPNLNKRPSTLMVSSGDYLKLRQLSLGYTLPEYLTNKAGLKSMRVYLSGANLVTFSKKFHGFDLEVGGDNLTRGIDNNSYPTPRSVAVGVQVGF